MPLTPVDRRAEDRLRQLQDFALLGKTLQAFLAEDQLVVEGHLEAALVRRPERHLDQDRGPGPQDFSRQTGGLLEIVSGNAELDGNAVLGIDHGTRVSAIPADAAEVRVLECARELEPITEQPVATDVPKPDERDVNRQ